MHSRTSRRGTNVPGSLLGGGNPAAGYVAESDRIGVQSSRAAKPFGFLHVGLTENDLGAGCFDRVVKSAEQDDSLAANLDLRTCHASPPSQEISATGKAVRGSKLLPDGRYPWPLLITYNNDYT